MGNREPHEAKKKSFDLGGNRTHDLRIRSTVTLPTELRGRTEKVGDRCLPGIWLFSVGQQVIASVSYQEDERKDNGEKGLRVTNTMLLWQNALKKNQAT